ncbi:MAG TPA: GGDEF domain-containing protein [Methylocystis sp.]|jgi:diguanylate cyclase
MMTESLIESRWAGLMQGASPAAKRLLITISRNHAPEFAAKFYEEMLQDSDANSFFAGEGTIERLRESMRRWIDEILTSWEPTAIPGLIAAQRQVGVVHARIGVSIELTMRGARLLKQTIIDSLLRYPVDNAHLEAAKIAIELIDMALEVMAQQYSASHEAEARKEETYRHYAATLNMSVERERQRAALFSWEAELLRAVVVGGPEQPLPPLSNSAFGLWLRHKAGSIFPEDGEFSEVVNAVERIDGYLVVFQRADSRRLIGLALNEAKRIQSLIESMFEHLVTLECGRDALTRLLSRRYQSTILSREIEMSRHSGKPFAALLLDIDHFKSVNDTYGHDAGDRVLRHVADVLAANVRSGDFVFRHGGEEFMILCVEVTAREAMSVADKIRAAIQAERIEIPDAAPLSVTVSIGVAEYDGHPDYQRLLARADQALYEAKNNGRNNCSLAA